MVWCKTLHYMYIEKTNLFHFHFQFFFGSNSENSAFYAHHHRIHFEWWKYPIIIHLFQYPRQFFFSTLFIRLFIGWWSYIIIRVWIWVEFEFWIFIYILYCVWRIEKVNKNEFKFFMRIKKKYIFMMIMMMMATKKKLINYYYRH